MQASPMARDLVPMVVFGGQGESKTFCSNHGNDLNSATIDNSCINVC